MRTTARLLIALWVLATAAICQAQAVHVTPLAKDDRILVTLRMTDVFTDEVRAAMHSGLRITFVYEVDLKRGTALWVDRTLASATVTASIEYDILTRRYLATRREDGRMESVETIESEEAARAWLTEFDKLPLFRTALARRQRRVLPASPRSHDAAQCLVRVAVGRWHRRARQVHVSQIARQAGWRFPHPIIMSGISTTREAPRPTLPARPGAAGAAERRPFRDNPRLILVGILLLIVALVAMVRLADRSTEINPDFLGEVVLYALSAADLTMLVALVFVLARNIVKLVVERRRGLPFSRFRAKLVLALLGLTIVPCVLVLIVGSELIRSSTEKWFSQPIDDVLTAATRIAQDYYRDREANVAGHATRLAREIPVAAVESGDLDGVRKAIEAEVAQGRVGLVEVYRVRQQPGVPPTVSPLLAVESPGLPPGDRLRGVRRSHGLARRRRDDRVRRPRSRSRGVAELVRAGAAIRDAGGPARRRRPRQRLSVRRVGAPRPAGHRGLPEPQPAVGDAAAAAGRLPHALRDDDADDSRQRDVDRSLSRQAHHAAGPTARRRRARDWRRPSRPPDRTGDARRVRSARRGVQHDGRGAGQQPAQARAIARRSRAEERRSSTSGVSTSRPSSSGSRPASSRSDPKDRSRPSTRRRCGCSKSIASVIGVRAEEVCQREDLKPLEVLLRQSRVGASAPAAQEIAILREGRELHLAAAATPLLRDDGSLGGAVLVFDDVTPLIRTQRVAAWRDVARRLAHEIKNPLTPIQLCAERMRRHFSAAPPNSKALVEECTSTIVGEVESLKDLVDEFAQFARMPAPQAVPADLNAVLTDTLSLYDGLFKAIRIERALAPDLPAVRVDLEQIRRVVINLVDNAVEVLGGSTAPPRPDGRTPTIVIETQHDPGNGVARILVADNGPGISAADRDKLFMPYYSTKRRGSGLGLAIVRRIVAEHGGSIEVADNVPAGTVFTIDLPV